MQVLWTDFAWEMLSQTADNIWTEFGYKSYTRFLEDVDSAVVALQQFPLLGKEEPLLAGRPLTYHSFVVEKRNKIVYVLDEERDIIIISDFWDVHREPQLLANSL